MDNRDRLVSRRKILRWLMLAGAGSVAAGCAPKPHGGGGGQSRPAGEEKQATDAKDAPHLVVSRGESPADITEAAVAALGGMERFVKKGYDVIIKPNICTDSYPYEYAATTNPEVVAALVKLSLGAGAKRVRVMDYPFGGTAASAYARSGIADAVQAAGGEMEVMNPNKFRETEIPQGKSIQKWDIYQDVLTCDLMINVPIAKHHSLARLTLGGKNLLGVIQKRGLMHAKMGQRVADLASVVKPGLTVVDAVRILMDHGPTGGNLNDVKLANTIIASQDIVAADSYATGLFGLTGSDIGYIKAGAEMGLGEMDLSKIKVEEISA
jgi:uncharacterized protein (DUF362 family)